MSQNSGNKSIWGILSPYRTRVAKFMSIDQPLVKPNIVVELITVPFGFQPIDTGGIDVGTPTKVGTNLHGNSTL